MQIELWPFERVIPYDRNPRQNDQAVDAVAASLREFGFRQPIVVDRDGVIVVGHTRWKAARKLGLTQVPVHVTDLTPEQAKAYRLADNQTATIAEWDKELLPLELADLKEANFDLGLLGFALAFGAHLRHNTKAPAFDPRERQFGIRQLIIVTTIVAVVFGAGRLAVPQMAEHLELTKGEGPIFVFLGVAAVILALPLILAALMRQFALPSVLIVLILLAIGTASEVPLLRLVGGGGPGPKVQDFVAINFFTASVLLTVLSMVRLNGYSLTRSLSG